MSTFYDKYDSGSHDSLSAFLDNEATSADLDALLASDVTRLADKIDGYHRIHHAMQPDQALIIDASSSFLAQMHAKLDADKHDTNVVAFPTQNATLSMPEKTDPAQWPTLTSASTAPKRPLWSGLAVAASVALVVVLGGNVLMQGDTATSTPVFAATPATPLVPPAASRSLSAEEALQNNERLQNYLRQHAQQASMTVGQGMIPMARVVGYPQDSHQ